MNLVVIIVVLLKFTLPVVFFWFPFQASWVNFILDSIDGDILMHYGLDSATYQTVDKLADYVTYIFMALVGYKWKIGRTIIALFIFRTIGQVLFFTTGNDIYFMIFQNYLEPLFMVYSFLLYKYKKNAFKIYKKYIVPIWIGIISYKMWNEYNVHLGKRDLSEIYFGFNN